jgi:hypothetical protein
MKRREFITALGSAVAWPLVSAGERDHGIHRYALLLFCLAMLVTDARQGVAQTGGLPPSLGSSMPSDIDLQSGFRLPFPKREDLDEAGKSCQVSLVAFIPSECSRRKEHGPRWEWHRPGRTHWSAF